MSGQSPMSRSERAPTQVVTSYASPVAGESVVVGRVVRWLFLLGRSAGGRSSGCGETCVVRHERHQFSVDGYGTGELDGIEARQGRVPTSATSSSRLLVVGSGTQRGRRAGRQGRRRGGVVRARPACGTRCCRSVCVMPARSVWAWRCRSARRRSLLARRDRLAQLFGALLVGPHP